MNDLLQRGSTWLQGKRAAEMSHAIEYRRGAASVAINASVGATPFEIARPGDLDAIVESVESRDFLITVAELIISATLVEPMAGDIIKETIGGTDFFFEVAGPGDGPCFRHSDPTKLTFRVHTKEAIEKT